MAPFAVCDLGKAKSGPNDLGNVFMTTYIHTPGHQAASRGHTVLRRLGQSRHLQCPSLGVLSPLRGRGREGERKREGTGWESRGREKRRVAEKREERRGRGEKGGEREEVNSGGGRNYLVMWSKVFDGKK